MNGTKVPDSPELIARVEHVINDIKDASDYTIGREDVARAFCRENPNANPGTATQSAVEPAAPELAPPTATASSETAQPTN